MNKVLVKFGGSNLKSTGDIQKIIRVVESYDTPIIIVVSAFYGVTDLLNKLIEECLIGKSIDYENLDIIISKYQDAINNYIDNKENHSEILSLLSLKKEQLINLLKQFLEEEGNTELRNIILSFGERLSSFVISNILSEHQFRAEEALPENIGLIANNKVENASVPLNSDFTKIKEKLSSDTIFVIPGFYAKSGKGQISLFGRGGSDYTAAIIAYATEAKSVDLWKDVSGFLSADPKIVDVPKRIEELSFLEAAELSYFGASIIHPGTIRPLIKSNIPLHIYNINQPVKGLSLGTKVSSKPKDYKQVLKSITYNNDYVLLRLKGAGVGIKKGILSAVTKEFDAIKINIRSVITSQIEIDFLLHKNDLSMAYQVVESLQDKNFDIEKEENISLIAAVGHGIKQATGIAGKIFGALAKADINIRHIVFGASDVAIYLIVDKSYYKTAIKAIHHNLFTRNN